MKKIFTVIALILLVVSNYDCQGQQIMQTINDVQELKVNEKLFVDKSFNILLKEIKPEIKRAYGEIRRAHGALSYFVFCFVDWDEQRLYNIQGKASPRITVFVKENFEWDKSKLPLAERDKWTKEDAIKYGNLTVVYFRVSGEKLTEKIVMKTKDEEWEAIK